MGDDGIECVVEYEYTADLSDELTLRVGDVITKVERMEGGWWKGSLRGVTGMFPDNFVKVLPGNMSGSPARGGEAGTMKKRARVLFSYAAAHDDELSLEVDEEIDLLSEVEDGWWKGRLKGRVGVFPSNFVELCNIDCDKPVPSHAATVEMKNIKNTLQGNQLTSPFPVFSPPSHKLETPQHKRENSANKENSANNSQGSLNGSMTTSERLLRNTAPAPDTAPRLPPKPEFWSSPVQLRHSTPLNTVAASQQTQQRIPLSSNLFDPEDEPTGPMFGSLAASRIQANPIHHPHLPAHHRHMDHIHVGGLYHTHHAHNYDHAQQPAPLLSCFGGPPRPGHGRLPHERRSSLQVTKEERKSSKPGLFSRLRHSFGSRSRIPFFNSRSSLGGQMQETQPSREKSPTLTRRKSIAAFIKRCTPLASSTDTKYNIKIERSERVASEAEILDISQPSFDNLSSLGVKTPRLLRRKSDFRDIPLSSEEKGDQDPETSVSWVFQEVDRKRMRDEERDLKLESDVASGRHLSGDSGVAWDSNLTNSTVNQSIRDMDSFFGGAANMTDEIFSQIFEHQSSSDLSHSNLFNDSLLRDYSRSSQCSDMVRGSQSDFCQPIQEEPEPASKPAASRNPIRTNPFVSWTPPASLKRTRNLEIANQNLQITEI